MTIQQYLKSVKLCDKCGLTYGVDGKCPNGHADSTQTIDVSNVPSAPDSVQMYHRGAWITVATCFH